MNRESEMLFTIGTKEEGKINKLTNNMSKCPLQHLQEVATPRLALKT